jgi:arylsulfatase A-like enzyme
MSRLTQSMVEGSSGGAIAGGLLGITEAAWLLSSTGTPDLLSPVYGVALYGLMGIGFGLAGGIAEAILSKALSFLKGKALGLGASAAIIPMAGFVLLYQTRKVVYAEQMPPLPVLAGIGIGLLAIAAALVFALPKKLAQPKVALGAWGALLLAGGVVKLADSGSGDAAAVPHGKPVPAEMEDKPNVLLLMVDTLRADHVSAYGKEDLKTPNMDALAEDGVLFEQCISQASWTRPSGVSIFTGRIPSGHSTQTKAARVPDTAVLFTETVHEAGVVTGGLSNNINLTSTFNLDQGYDTFLYEAPNYPFGGTESVFGLTFYKVVVKVIERLFPEAERTVGHYYQPADVVLEDAKKFIGANKDSRWMLYAHIMEPHDPYFEHPSVEGTGQSEYNGIAYGRAENERPDPKDTEYLKRIYKHEVEFMDLELGRFFAWMKEQGVYDNTAIILVSDHGEEFNEHGGFWHGTTLYDEVLHVPLLIKTAGGPKGVRVGWQVRSMDIAPTISDLYGLPPDSSWEGESLLPDILLAQEQNKVVLSNNLGSSVSLGDLEKAIEEKSPKVSQKVLCEQERSKENDRIAISENDFEGNILSGIRMEGFKLVAANEGNPRGLATTELYDIVGDPSESKNRSEGTEEACEVSDTKRMEKMRAVMGELLSASQQSAAHGEGTELDEATIERMKALGYMEE